MSKRRRKRNGMVGAVALFVVGAGIGFGAWLFGLPQAIGIEPEIR